jgi:hypothetical protein
MILALLLPALLSMPTILRTDEVRILEARRLVREYGDSIWTGWSAEDVPVLLVDEAYEFLIGHPSPPQDWRPLEFNEALKGEVYGRDRVFGRDARHALRIGGVPCVVIGKPFWMRKNSTGWVLALMSSYFEIYQWRRGGDKLGRFGVLDRLTEGDSRIRLLPKDESLRFLALDMAEAIRFAYECPDQERKRVEMERSLAARAAFREHLSEDPELLERFERWEWVGGLKGYTRIRVLEMAVEGRPLHEFEALSDFHPYADILQDTRIDFHMHIDGLRDLPLSEGAFMGLGTPQALVLDDLCPTWKSRCFAPGVWMPDLLRDCLERFE